MILLVTYKGLHVKILSSLFSPQTLTYSADTLESSIIDIIYTNFRINFCAHIPQLEGWNVTIKDVSVKLGVSQMNANFIALEPQEVVLRLSNRTGKAQFICFEKARYSRL